jgi:hypothetical protein
MMSVFVQILGLPVALMQIKLVLILISTTFLIQVQPNLDALELIVIRK